MTLKEIEQKVRNFLSGQAGTEGEDIFNRWYESFEEEAEHFPSEEKRQLKNRIYARISSQMDRNTAQTRLVKMKRRRLNRVWSVAASILILLVAYVSITKVNSKQEFVFQTTYGETERLHLPDGSNVILNANSELKYHNKNPREVWLKGEAFFDVMKLPVSGKKFLVHTDDLIVEVLGTSFNVNSRHQKTKVVLEEGSIKLNLNDGQEELMQPGDLISYSSKNAKILEKRTAVKAQTHSSWKDGSILFDLISLEAAIEKVADHYGIIFKFERPELKNKVIEGGVPMDDLKLSLLTIEISTNVKIKEQEGHYLIHNIQDQ